MERTKTTTPNPSEGRFIPHEALALKDLPRERMEHIVTSLGFKMSEFDRLMEAAVLRDEIIKRCVDLLEQLDDRALESAQRVIRALIGGRG